MADHVAVRLVAVQLVAVHLVADQLVAVLVAVRLVAVQLVAVLLVAVQLVAVQLVPQLPPIFARWSTLRPRQRSQQPRVRRSDPGILELIGGLSFPRPAVFGPVGHTMLHQGQVLLILGDMAVRCCQQRGSPRMVSRPANQRVVGRVQLQTGHHGTHSRSKRTRHLHVVVILGTGNEKAQPTSTKTSPRQRFWGVLMDHSPHKAAPQP